MRRLLTRARSPLLLAALALTSGCVADWLAWFDQMANLNRQGDEYRVRDLRVLALEVEPAEIVYPAEVLLLDDDDPRLAELPSVSLSVRGRAFDPRGGEVHVTMQLCAGPAAADFFSPGAEDDCAHEDDLASLPPDVLAALAPVRRVVKARVDEEPAGPLDDLDFAFELTPRVLREIARRGGQTTPDLAPVRVQVRLQVSRRVRDQAENEVAVLPLYARADVLSERAPPGVREAVLSRWDAEVCDLEEPPDCIPAIPRGDPEAPSECGDFTIEGPETCDPPDGRFCDDECQIIGMCPYVCVYDVPPNTPPLVYGFDVLDDFDFEPRLSQADDADVPSGGVVRVEPGALLHLRAVLDEARASEPHMEVYLSGREPPFLVSDSVQLAWYLVGNEGEIVNPPEFSNQGFMTGGISYQAPASRAPGERDTLFVVVTDLFGGAAFSRIDVEYQEAP